MVDLNLAWRYAVKKFDPTKSLSQENERLLLETLRQTPSSFGLQPWLFYAIRDPELKQKMSVAAYGQQTVIDAPLLIVLCGRSTIETKDIDEYIDSCETIRGANAEELAPFRKSVEGFLRAMDSTQLQNWASRQVYIAFGFLLLTAAANGIDSCPIEGFKPEEVAKLLNLEEQGYVPWALCALGYRHAADPFSSMAKVRYETDRVIKKI